MSFIWESMELLPLIINSGILFFLLLAIDIVIFGVIKRAIPNTVIIFTELVLIASYIIKYNIIFILSVIILISLTILFLFANIGDLRDYISNYRKKKNKLVTHKYDLESVKNVLHEAVATLSASKTGAIITIERKTDLTNLYKNGVIINAPIKKELLETIFYNGTRLHDGAVIIKEDIIAAAAVFYVPSTKTYVCKYGSRHRAAIGISEVSDSVTIVVSEETGNVSFAINGRIEQIDMSNFDKMFMICMTEK